MIGIQLQKIQYESDLVAPYIFTQVFMHGVKEKRKHVHETAW